MTYRKCRECGKDWNVSSIDKGGGKHYICPTCEYRMRLKEKAAPRAAIPRTASKKHTTAV